MIRRARLPQLAVHGAHHKMGTVWMATTLRSIAREFNLTFQQAPHGLEHPPIDPATDIYFDGHSRFDPSTLREFRGSHMVRDLRDVVISGYHYHLWTDEAWANKPLGRGQRKRFGLPADGPDLTYVELLNSLPKHEGILTEMRRLETLCAQLEQWDFDHPSILEVHFEDMMRDGDRHFAELFRWWGFEPEFADRAAEIAMSRHISKIKSSGNDDPHLRSGEARQWEAEFEPDHIAAAKERFGGLLIRMGYESGLDW